jgi:hypothetical protein
MSLLVSIASAIGSKFVGDLIDRGAGLFELYLKKEISREELANKLQQLTVTSFTEIEVSHAKALSETFATFMQAAEKSLLLKVVWASAAISQLLVLLWHQAGIPALIALGYVSSYPSSGSTVEWAYALLAACLGFGPAILRTGPAAGSGLLTSLKQFISR